MLLLSFQIGDERYAIDSRQVVEVVPLVQLKPLPHAPAYVAGLFQYRGMVIPVVDLRQLMQDEESPQRLSTRVILVTYQPDGHPERTIGLVAERVTATIDKESSDFAPSGVTVEDTPYLGEVADDGEGLIQSLTVENLLPDPVRKLLFPETAEKN